MNIKRIFFLVLYLFVSYGYTSSSIKPILKNADFNQNTLQDGSYISLLMGNVIIQYDDITIHSDQATWAHNSGVINFISNITVHAQNQKLTCHTLDFFKNEKKLVAKGNVTYSNSLEQLHILSPYAEYSIRDKLLLLNENPVLYKIDTIARETLSLQSVSIRYNDSTKIAHALNSVNLKKGILHSTCETATYDSPQEVTFLRGSPQIVLDYNELQGDSINLYFTKKKLKGISVQNNAQVFYRDTIGKDTAITKVFGDSLFISINDSESIETIRAYRNTRAFHYSTSDTTAKNEARGKAMILSMIKGKTGTLNITGNARSLYYLNDEKNSGKNEANGDSILISFDTGKVTFIKLKGDVRGTYTLKTF